MLYLPEIRKARQLPSASGVTFDESVADAWGKLQPPAGDTGSAAERQEDLPIHKLL